MKKATKQQGFTLIELMIVVAVIGVLAAVALPQYQKYVAKSEVASVLATLTGVKTNIEAFTVENGLFPSGKDSDKDQNNDALGVPSSFPLGTVAIARTDETDGGTVTFTFTSVQSGASSLVADKTIVLTRDASNESWTCKQGTKDGVAQDLLPRSCK
ncbi:pilin [Vibrio maritimus]